MKAVNHNRAINATFVLQVFHGIMAGASFQPGMLQVMGRVFFPVITSTLLLVGTGLLLSVDSFYFCI